MATYTITMPDVGEGIAEAELVELNVKVGDTVLEDDVIGSVMTDKATVEIPSLVMGRITWIAGAVGDTLAIGAPFVHLQVTGDVVQEPAMGEQQPISVSAPEMAAPANPSSPKGDGNEVKAETVARHKPLASPAVRKRAKNAGLELDQLTGSGPKGRITQDDVSAHLAPESGQSVATARAPDRSVRDIKVTGLRRRIAERMAEAKRQVAHITIVEEIDVTSLEELRAQLNKEREQSHGKLTLLPLLISAIVKAVGEQPALNAHFDDKAEVIHEFGGVHAGIATQTANGLMVPVVRHCESLPLWQCAAEIARLAEAARNGKAKREELSGSTITISSLGPLGAILTTPIINQPEVAIVGVNRIAIKPSWNGSAFVPRKMLNLSCSFDHRVIDGWDAAVFVNRLKTLLETPAIIFII